MKKIFISLLCFSLGISSSCHTKKQEEKQSSPITTEHDDSPAEGENILYKEVMSIHDEVMPVMGELMALNKQVKQKIDTVEDAKLKEALQQVSSELEAANEGMMNWMRKFNPNIKNMTYEETINYLTEEKKKIEEVRKNMLSAKENASSMLQE